MIQACTRLIKEAATRDGTFALRRRFIQRRIVKFSGACLATVAVLGAVEAGLVFIVMY